MPASRSPHIFSMSEALAALQPDAQVRVLPFAQRGGARADWLIGMKPVHDPASVHADYWERHPRGDEVLTLLEGLLQVTVRSDAGAEQSFALRAGESLVVPCGHWHRLEVRRPGRLMFVTPAQGSEHRLRAAFPPPTETSSGHKPPNTPSNPEH